MSTIELNSHTIILPLILTIIAGLATAIGSLIFLFIKQFKESHLSFCLGLSAGAMLYISFVELLRLSINHIGFVHANVVFLVGIGCMMLIDFLVPHQYFEENTELDPKHKKLYSTGILLALGIAIHNLPEGFAVFISAASNLHLGTALAVAIAAHNIPEGIAVSIPIYYATRSKSKAFTLSLLSGIAEPIGALLGILILGSVLTDTTVNYLFSLVAGIMVFICFDELLPQAFSRKFHQHAISGIFFGIIVMMISLSI